MILDNYYGVMTTMIAANCPDASLSEVAPKPVVNTSGTKLPDFSLWPDNSGAYNLPKRMMQTPVYPGMLSQTSEVKINGNCSANIVIGSGVTPAQISDYRLENEIIEGVSYVSNGYSVSSDYKSVMVTKTMQNTSSDVITITEIGYTVPWARQENSYYKFYQIMVNREVLSTPIVAAPGESFTVSFVFNFN